MNFDFVLGCDAFANQDIGDFLSLVTTQLDNFTHFRVLHQVPIAGKVFLESRQGTFGLKAWRQSLDRSDRLSSGPLLYTDI